MQAGWAVDEDVMNLLQDMCCAGVLPAGTLLELGGAPGSRVICCMGFALRLHWQLPCADAHPCNCGDTCTAVSAAAIIAGVGTIAFF